MTVHLAEIQQAKKIPMNASRGGDYRRKESPAHIQCRVAGPILVNLLLGPVREHLIDVRIKVRTCSGSEINQIWNPSKHPFLEFFVMGAKTPVAASVSLRDRAEAEAYMKKHCIRGLMLELTESVMLYRPESWHYRTRVRQSGRCRRRSDYRSVGTVGEGR